MVADAVSRATHPLSQLVSHEGHTLAAENPQEPYSALSLKTASVRRDPIQFYKTTSSGYPTLVDESGATSSGNTSAPSTARKVSPEELLPALTSENSRSVSTSLAVLQTIPCYYLRSSYSTPSLISFGDYGAPPNTHHPQFPAPHKYVNCAHIRGDPTAPHTPQPICFNTTPSNSRELGEDFDPRARERNIAFRAD